MNLRFQLPQLATALLVICASILLAAIGFELDWGRRIRLPMPSPKLQENKLVLAPLLPEFSLPPLDPTYAAVLDRPLFVPSRRPPPPPPPVVPPKPAMRKGQFVLLGVILTKDLKLAFLRETATGKTIRLEQGKEINGILLASMEKEKVVLKQWDDQEELLLKIQPAPRIQAPPPPAAALPTAGAAPAAAPPPPTGGQPTDIIAQRRALRGLPP